LYKSIKLSNEPSPISNDIKDGKKSFPIKKQKNTKSSMILSKSNLILILGATYEYSR